MLPMNMKVEYNLSENFTLHFDHRWNKEMLYKIPHLVILETTIISPKDLGLNQV